MRVTIERLPRGLVPSSGTLNFTHDTIPPALKEEHTLSAGHWGVMHVFDGSLRFMNLETGEEETFHAPSLIMIHPEVPHRVEVEGELRCRIDFFRQLNPDDHMRTPGAYADEDVRRSFERCEAAGEFADLFYSNFFESSPMIAPYFAETDFTRQKEALRDSVHMMVHRDAADPEMQGMLYQLGETHSRDRRNVLPELYELWLDSVCATVSVLDPEWSDDLERRWRVRLRAGMQIIMAAY